VKGLSQQPQLRKPLVEAVHDGLRVDVITEVGEHPGAAIVVDGSPVVRVDEREVPQLVSLVDVGDAGGRELHQRHRQRGQPAGLAEASTASSMAATACGSARSPRT
jgi:hypothetical protein